MTMITYAGNLSSISQEEDLKLRPGININPPPSDGSCDGCGRQLSQLKPYGKAGDPLVGDFEGALLLKRFRRDTPYNEFMERIFNEFFGNWSTVKDFQKAKEKLVQKYDKEKAEYIIHWIQRSTDISASWECRNCAVLDDYAFRERKIDSLDAPERCDCCGRHLGALRPFTEGDPVGSYFKGKLLARRMRPDAPHPEGVNKMMDEFFGNCITYEDYEEAGEKLLQKYGEEKTHELCTFAFFLNNIFKSSWECRDCIALDTHQYFKKKMAQDRTAGPLIQAKPMPA